ncbi:MAG: (2Fe-2S)-binding protein [Desulfarculus sp.]|jgi:carbon-monoxide dehydrogenase small subunit|nr:MAG: (2Fe-2S)-binding protein [Desulfarculus sp.]
MSTLKLSFKVNGKLTSLAVAPNALLVDVLREDLGLTGTKAGCREGECGACTVLLDGEPVNSCLLPAMKAAGREVTTIEGLVQEDGTLHALQQSFTDQGASQCGFCTPAMILNAKALLDKAPHPDEGQIRQALSGVLCRCTGYRKIVQAVQNIAQGK